jgi:hypothetical protein
MRTSDAERQKVAEFLRDACADGRLSPEELEERLDALFAGTTVADISALVRDLPGGAAVVPRLGGRPQRRPPAAVPMRRRRAPSPAVPIGLVLLVVGIGSLVFAALPPLIAILFAAIALSLAVAVGVIAVALAPVGLALFGIAWLVNRVVRGGGPPSGWFPYGPRRGPHRFM